MGVFKEIKSLVLEAGDLKGDPLDTGKVVPIDELQKSLGLIHNYLEGVYDSSSYFGMVLRLRNSIPNRNTDINETIKSEGEFLGSILAGMRTGLVKIHSLTRDKDEANAIACQCLYIDYLASLIVSPAITQQKGSGTPVDTTTSLLAELDKRRDTLRWVDPNFLDHLDKHTPRVSPRTKIHSNSATPRVSSLSKADDAIAKYSGTIQTNNYRLANELYVTKILSWDGKRLDKEAKKIDPGSIPQEIDENQALITIDEFEFNQNGRVFLPCPRGCEITGIAGAEEVFITPQGTYQITPDGSGQIKYCVTITGNKSKLPEVAPVSSLPITRPEYVGDTVPSIVGTLKLVPPIYSIEPWVDSIYQAAGSRALLAMEALQIFKCDTASQYLAFRFQEKGIPCQLISGICAQGGSFNVAAGHVEVEYQGGRLSAGDITHRNARIPSETVDHLKIRSLLNKIPSLSDTDLFLAILDFQEELPRDGRDPAQHDRERALFGDGAQPFDREEVAKYSPEAHAYLIKIVSEEVDLAEKGKLSGKELKKLFEKFDLLFELDRNSSSQLDELIDSPKFKEYYGYSSGHNLPNRVISCCRTLLTIDSEYDQITTNYLKRFLPSHSDRGYLRLQAFEVLGADRLKDFTPFEKAILAYSLLRDSGRHALYDFTDRSKKTLDFANEILKFVNQIPNVPEWFLSNDHAALLTLCEQATFLEHLPDLEIRLRAYAQLMELSGRPLDLLVYEISRERSPYLPKLFDLFREHKLFQDHIKPGGGVSEEFSEKLNERLMRGISLIDLVTLERCGIITEVPIIETGWNSSWLGTTEYQAISEDVGGDPVLIERELIRRKSPKQILKESENNLIIDYLRGLSLDERREVFFVLKADRGESFIRERFPDLTLEEINRIKQETFGYYSSGPGGHRRYGNYRKFFIENEKELFGTGEYKWLRYVGLQEDMLYGLSLAKYRHQHESIPRKPDGTDFKGIRDYQQGDPFRRVNWKVSARTGRFVVNTYEEPEIVSDEVLVSLDDEIESLHRLDIDTYKNFVISVSERVGASEGDLISVAYQFRGKKLAHGVINRSNIERELFDHLEQAIELLDQLFHVDRMLMHIGLRY